MKYDEGEYEWLDLTNGAWSGRFLFIDHPVGSEYRSCRDSEEGGGVAIIVSKRKIGGRLHIRYQTCSNKIHTITVDTVGRGVTNDGRRWEWTTYLGAGEARRNGRARRR